MKRLLILFLLFAVNVSAQEVLPEFTQETIPVLNDHLRNVDRRLRGAVNKDLLNVTGVLPLANGGTETALTAPSEDGIFFYDYSEGAVDFLTIDTGITINGTTILTSGHFAFYSSDNTFTVPSGITSVSVTMIGGGAGGGGGANAGTYLSGTGGAGGAYVINYPFTVTPGDDLSLTVGAGGAGGAGSAGSPGSDGVAGGSSSFSTLSVAGGGSGQGANDGTPTGGISPGVLFTELNGAAGGGSGGLGGGSAAGVSSGDGGTVPAADQRASGGGGTPWGIGGDGNNSANGDDATGYGAGGGGGGGTSHSGGAGSSGFVLVQW